MAKKTNPFSHPKATEKLDQLAQSGTSATELIYDILRIFANFGDGQVRRTKEGPGNAIHDGKTVLEKKLNVEKIKTFERFNPFRYGGLFNPKEVCRLGDDKYDNPDEPYDDEEEEQEYPLYINVTERWSTTNGVPPFLMTEQRLQTGFRTS
jgi:hypothetical protein